MFKISRMSFAAGLHVQIILHANAKAQVFADHFWTHFNTVALLNVPKVEFNLKVIMYFTIFVS